jgi:hypothetical protein
MGVVSNGSIFEPLVAGSLITLSKISTWEVGGIFLLEKEEYSTVNVR